MYPNILSVLDENSMLTLSKDRSIARMRHLNMLKKKRRAKLSAVILDSKLARIEDSNAFFEQYIVLANRAKRSKKKANKFS